MSAFAIAKRIFIQMFRDKRTLALMWVAPLLLFTLMYFLFTSSGENATYKVGVYNLNPEIVENLEENHINATVFSSGEHVAEIIKNNQLVAFITQNDATHIEITYENSAPAKRAVVRAKLQGALVKLQLSAFASLAQKTAAANPSLAQAVPQPTTVDERYLYGEADSDYFTTISPVLLGFFVFFLVFLISGMALLRERTSGTLDKVLAAPVRRWEIIAGYFLGYGFFCPYPNLIAGGVCCSCFACYRSRKPRVGDGDHLPISTIGFIFRGVIIDVRCIGISNGAIHSSCDHSANFLFRNHRGRQLGELATIFGQIHAAVLHRECFAKCHDKRGNAGGHRE
ncbi:Hypothetical protein Tcol_1956 [Trichococcus collinsii]|uniref:ABC-2 family transporter protein n=1 Tax=Trichococcus collinsii TaxID=157076 RepID=A0AB38A3J2_9LACT|nr:ABC transporter permease [Trichococcus collinsii]CZR01691.1 Hypothetical protein Tcol_1956 [Trichococcus collinsii]SEA90859.1 ABC-2 family transporter protein [Trichococcus collinsii]